MAAGSQTYHQFASHLLRKRWGIAIAILTFIIVIVGALVALPRSQAVRATGTPTITISPTSGAYSNRDDQVPITVHGTNFGSNETINIYWNYVNASNPGTLVTPTYPANPTTTNNLGTFTTYFLDVLAATGTYTIAAVGQSSGAVATGTFTLYPQLYIRPQAGGPGSTITFYGNAFAAGESVKILWKYTASGKGTLLTTAIANSTGSFAVNANIPNNKPGKYTVGAVGQTSSLVAKYSVNIYTPTLALAPLSGSANTPLTVSAYGFTGGESVDVYWNNGTTPLATGTTSEFGYLSPIVITVPAGTLPGPYPVKVVGQVSHITSSNTYTVVSSSSSLSISSGPVGAHVQVSGQGYAPNETVNILWNYSGPGTGSNVASITAGLAGTITASFTVPLATNGAYTVAAVGTSSQSVTQHTFTLNNSLITNPTTSPPGKSVTVAATGYQSNESVQLYWDNTSGTSLATATADSNGNINMPVTLPSSAIAGIHSLIGVGQSSSISFTASVTIDTQWGDFGFDQVHHRENAYEHSLNASNVANLQLKWTGATASGLKDSAVYANGLVYVGTANGYLNAYDATSGTLKWQFNCQCIFRSLSAPLVDPATNMVYFGTVGYADEGIPSPFYALDAQTGTLKWSLILPWHQLGFPTLAFNMLYVGISHLDHGSCALYAIDELSGHITWSYATDAGVWGAVGVDPTTQTVFTGTGNPEATVLSLNALTGTKVWETSVPQYGPDDDIGSAMTIANGYVYLSSKNGEVHALNETTGAIVWSTFIGAKANGDISSQALSSQGVLYVGSTNGYLYALNASNGTILWRTHTGGPIFSSPVVANGVVYFASLDGKLYAIDAGNGATLWSYNTGLASYSSPIVVNGWLYCGSTNGNLYAFSL